MSALATPTIADVQAARRRIAPYLAPTALYTYAALDALSGARLFLKHENHLPVAAFKVRGGVNLVATMTAEERAKGVMGASTGNHGQSIAYAAHLFGAPATIFVPVGANPVKVAAMEGLGATVIAHGADFDEARERCAEVAAERGARYIHSGDEPLLIAGVGTYTAEILDARPDIEVIIVPVGGGSGAAGACIVAKSVDPAIEVIGVQSAQAPAAFQSWRDRTLGASTSTTIAEGLATRVAFELPQRILWRLLDDFLLVDDEQILDAQATLIETTRNLVEAAGAAAFAAVMQQRERFAGRRVAIVISGGNASPAQIVEVLSR